MLYQRSPVGFPHHLMRGDGTPADTPDAKLALLMQEVAWQATRATPLTGEAPEPWDQDELPATAVTARPAMISPNPAIRALFMLSLCKSTPITVSSTIASAVTAV